MAPKICDTFSFLLENPQFRQLAFVPVEIEYASADFSQEIYEQSSSRRFASRAAAYADWVARGRAEGQAYQPGKDTCLKIILKVRDEPALLRRWIEHHAAMVGCHNIVIMDCGSTDARHLAILAEYERRILILKYEHYYDRVHNVAENGPFYNMIAKTCRYLTVLDADEFLFFREGEHIFTGGAAPLLREGDEAVYAGTWFTNTDPPDDAAGRIDFSRPIGFALGEVAVDAGTVAGKAVVRADLCAQIGHIGHNLHAAGALARLGPGSFGRIGIFHLCQLGPGLMQPRSLKHLRTRGIVPGDVAAPQEVQAHLRARLQKGDLSRADELYAQRYLGTAAPLGQGAPRFTTSLLAGAGAERQEALAAALETFDFAALLERYRALSRGAVEFPPPSPGIRA